MKRIKIRFIIPFFVIIKTEKILLYRFFPFSVLLNTFSFPNSLNMREILLKLVIKNRKINRKNNKNWT